jgi:D-amino peptidase
VRIYLMTDLEGVAGVWKWDERESDASAEVAYRTQFRRLLTGEVNAAVAGFYEGGADEVIVNDGHGAGATLDVEALDSRVTLIQGRDRPFWLPLLDESCDATALVGAHAKAGTPRANLCHTMCLPIRNYSFNGVSHGEIGMQAMIAGHFGVPLIFLSGDLHACREVEGFIPGVRTVAVKEGLSLLSAATLPHAAACERIREGARESLRLVGSVVPYTVPGPLTFTDERYEPTFDPANPPEGVTILDEHTQQLAAPDIVALVRRYYGYPPA